MPPPPTCPECGAPWAAGRTCQEIFDELLILEFTDPAYGAVHFLTVSCFMVQHGRYSDAGLTWIEGALRDHLERGASVEDIRDRAGRTADQRERDWKVARQPSDPPAPKRSWSMTIVDAIVGYEDPAVYREKIREWARVTLKEMT